MDNYIHNHYSRGGGGGPENQDPLAGSALGHEHAMEAMGYAMEHKHVMEAMEHDM